MVLGIDLGTSNSVAASLSRDGRPVLIPDANNKEAKSTPSLVLLEGKKAYAGSFADTLFELYPDKKLISFFKRSFGTADPVHVDEFGNPWFSESIAALILKKLRFDAELALPDGFQQTVITVPAHYNDIQRKSVIEAARLAGLPLTGILEEPVAAALFYGNVHSKIEDEIILVYDFGGGTFDLTMITRSGDHLHVIAKDGISKLGGKEFDEIVSNNIKEKYQKAFGIPFPTDKLSANRLQKISEKIKIELNEADSPLNLNKWMLFGYEAFECSFRYGDYISKAHPLILRTEAALNRCLRSLGMQFSNIHKMILIGGTSSSKLVYNFWKNKIGKHQELIYHQPLSSVAKGAALYAASLSDNVGMTQMRPIELRSVSTYNIGLAVLDRPDRKIDTLIYRNTPLPVSAKRIYEIDPARNNTLRFGLCQFWEESDVQQIGIVKAGPFEAGAPFFLEANIENRLNGTIGIKLFNASTGKDIRFEFIREESHYKYDYNGQQALVDNVYLNNYI